MKDRTTTIFKQFLERYPSLVMIADEISASMDEIISCYYNRGTVVVCGNGGSASDCEHIVGELMKGFRLHRPIDTATKEELTRTFSDEGAFIAEHIQTPIPAISLVSHSALMTAYCNDLVPELVFAQQVYGYCSKKDVLIAVSTSGNSKNVLYATMMAKTLGTTVIGLTGKTGGQLATIADITIKVPETETFAIQELHLPVYHVLCAMIESEIFEK